MRLCMGSRRGFIARIKVSIIVMIMMITMMMTLMMARVRMMTMRGPKVRLD